MANKDPSRTEKPTGKKVREARNTGNVLNSPDVLSFGMLLGGTLLMLLVVPMTHDAFLYTLNHIGDIDCRNNWNSEQLRYGMMLSIKVFAGIVAPACLCFCAI